MDRILRRRPSPATVIACIALFVSLGGVGYAATQIGSAQIKNNSVRGTDIRNGTVTSKDLKNSSATGKDIKNNSLTGSDVNEAKLGAVPSAENADKVGKIAPEDFYRYTGGVPSGKTVVGAWGAQRNNLAAAETFNQVVELPVPAATGVAAANVNFAPSASAGDDDATCAGSYANPSAPAGKVCLYLSNVASNVQANSLSGYQINGGSAADNKFGFNVGGNAAAAGDVDARGSWAYTAP